MANLSANLFAAWSEGEDSEPDPSTLPGLLSLSESHLEESVESFLTLSFHFDAMQQRVLTAQNNLKQMLGKADDVPPEIAEAIQSNLDAFDDFVTLLEDLQALDADDDADSYWELLGAFEESSDSIRAANLQLIEATDSFQE